MLKNLPKSGGWLNSVKVVLGFIEVALGMKFLSVADQTYHWGLLDREVYLAIWIVVFALLGLYLLGKIKFAHDSDMPYLSVGRLTLAIVVLSFVVYLIPGMWGAPLKALSGYLPPSRPRISSSAPTREPLLPNRRSTRPNTATSCTCPITSTVFLRLEGGRGLCRRGEQADLHRLHGARLRELPRNGGPRGPTPKCCRSCATTT